MTGALLLQGSICLNRSVKLIKTNANIDPIKEPNCVTLPIHTSERPASSLKIDVMASRMKLWIATKNTQDVTC